MRPFLSLLAFILMSAPCYAAKGVPFDAQDGEFSAKLALTDPKEFEQYKKPSDQGLILNIPNKAKPGEKIGIHVLFMGMALDKSQLCDVTYDLKIIEPSGKIGMDEKNIPALREKILNKELVFHSRATPVIEFDNELGVYKFYALVHDNVGHKKVPLTAQIEIVK